MKTVRGKSLIVMCLSLTSLHRNYIFGQNEVQVDIVRFLKPIWLGNSLMHWKLIILI